MSVYYDLYQNPPKKGEQDERFHARVLPKGTIPAEKFMEIVHNATGFSEAILRGTLQSVIDELQRWLADGWIVEVGELERKSSPYVSHSGLTLEQRQQRLLLHLDKHGCIIRTDYEQLTGITKGQALADLNRFIEEGIVRKYGSGKTVVYLKV